MPQPTCSCVALGVPHVEAGAAGVRKHVQHIVLGLRCVQVLEVRRSECLVLRPVPVRLACRVSDGTDLPCLWPSAKSYDKVMQTHRCHFSSISGKGYAVDLSASAVASDCGCDASAGADAGAAAAAAWHACQRRAAHARRCHDALGRLGSCTALGSTERLPRRQTLLRRAWLPSTGRRRCSMTGDDPVPVIRVRSLIC